MRVGHSSTKRNNKIRSVRRSGSGGSASRTAAMHSLATVWEFEPDAHDACSAAAEGRLEKLKWLHAEGHTFNVDTCSAAAAGGHIDVVKWLRAEGCPWDASTCRHAAQGGHLDVLQWLRSEGCPWDKWTCRNAAQGGHLHVVRWAIENGCPQ